MKSTGLTVVLMILVAFLIYCVGAQGFVAMIWSGFDVVLIRIFQFTWYASCIYFPVRIWKRHKRVAPKKAEPAPEVHLDMNDSSY